jgi:3-oxoadipate enol-lactonase
MNTATKGYNLIVPANSISISYDDLGEGSVPIIFLHGFPFDKSMWKEQLEFFSSSHRVIAVDIRGFGKSTDEESSLSIDLFGNDLIHFMDALGFEKAIICGLSMGGYIALNSYGRFANRFEALILCDTQCINDSNEVTAKRLEAITKVEAGGPGEFNEDFVKKVFHPDSLTEKKELVEELKVVVSANSQHIIAEGLRVLSGRSETCSTLAKISVPTLIICGREDEVTPLAQSESMQEAIDGAELQVVEKAGHVSNLEQPEVFNGYLQDFLSRISPD